LLRPGAWPQAPGCPVDLVETHISWVFLVDRFAYKVKKPVKLDFLDFSTLALRRHFCEEELRLNRRFAPGLYLGLSRIVAVAGGLAVDVPGKPVEYAVRMQRFDRTQELDALLARGEASPGQLYDFGAKLALQQEAAPVAGARQPWADPARTLAACRENFAELRRPGAGGFGPRADRLAAWTEERYPEIAALLRRRRDAGRFRECHGDLHCANVVRHGEELWAFDALEFDPSLHWIDVANDLAFLYMDLRARGHAGLGAALLDGWLTASGDFGALATLRFYEAYRATVRAKVAAIRMQQSPGAAAALTNDVDRYLGAAERATTVPQPLLVATTGLSGSGKSWLASRLLGPLDAVRLRSDVERKRLCGLPETAATGGSIYSGEITRRTYAHLGELAAAALRDGFSVVVDAASLRARERQAFREVAAAAGVPFRLLCVSADPATLRRRIGERAAQGGDASEATVGVLEHQLAAVEPPGADELDDAVCVDTGLPVDPDAVARELLRGRCPRLASRHG